MRAAEQTVRRNYSSWSVKNIISTNRWVCYKRQAQGRVKTGNVDTADQANANEGVYRRSPFVDLKSSRQLAIVVAQIIQQCTSSLVYRLDKSITDRNTGK